MTGEGLSVQSNRSPGAIFIGSKETSHLVALGADNNLGYGVLVLDGSLELTNPVIANTRSDGVAGPGEGLSLALNASVRVGGSDSKAFDNQSHGIAIQGNSRLNLDNFRAQSNGGYGVYAACNQSILELSGELLASDNALGPQLSCP